MKWHHDEHGKLVITVTKKEQRSLKVAQRRDHLLCFNRQPQETTP
jgi:hypothetical protein